MLVTLIIAILLAPLALLTLCFAVELFAGLRPLSRREDSAVNYDAVIIVPAHDEEPVLEKNLRQLKEAAGEIRILVVADNCTDRTALVARQVGVEVVERNDPSRRGKGFALDFARSHLKADPPGTVLIVDADCTIDAASIRALSAACAAEDAPCQATNLQKPSPNGSVAVQLSTFAFFIKNVIRERGLQRLTGGVHMLGTGMALPWHLFAAAKLATSDIVEDLKLGLELSEAGHPPKLVEEAQVWSNPETDSNTLSQRKRWEGGFIANALSTGPSMLARALVRGNFRRAWAAVDIMIPPFALLFLLDVSALTVAAALCWLASADLWLLLILCGPLLLALLGVSFAWAAGGSKFVSFKSLARAPFYVAWKLPMYLGLARRGAPKEWTRTGR